MKKLVIFFLSLVLMAGLLPMAQAADLPYVEIDWYVGAQPQMDQQTVNDKLNEYLLEKLNMKVNFMFMSSGDWVSKMGTMCLRCGFGHYRLWLPSQSTMGGIPAGAFYPLPSCWTK